MKRSDVNKAIIWSKEFFEREHISLPAFAYWSKEEWTANKDKTEMIKHLMLGWDITDFGMNDFYNLGCVLFTLRNGDQKDSSKGVPYAEKYILCKEGQRLPLHYHVSKTEDIINRAGGNMYLYLRNADPKTGELIDTDVEVWMDGILRTFKPMEEIVVTPGNSITLKPFVAHIFGAKKGHGDLLAGEVSAVNDDNTDNYFKEPVARFSEIEEDESILHPLCNEYEKFSL